MENYSCSTSSRQLPGLTRVAVGSLILGWDDGGLWHDVLFLADRYLSACDSEEQTLRWHHFVMAVGNFKRQPGRRLRPASPSRHANQSPIYRPEKLTVPGREGTTELRREDQATWQALSNALKGAAVATTTTLLAALWPERHFVFDRRVFAAANGLRIAGGLEGTTGVRPSSNTPPPKRTFDDYAQVRSWVLDACSELAAPTVSVERALYELALKIPVERPRTWKKYADFVADEVERHQ